MTENCRKISSYAEQKFHLMPESSLLITLISQFHFMTESTGRRRGQNFLITNFHSIKLMCSLVMGWLPQSRGNRPAIARGSRDRDIVLIKNVIK